jgi:hypothetical protein
MDVVRQQVAADELMLMPDDGFRYELVKGELRRMDPAENVHGRVTMSFAWRSMSKSISSAQCTLPKRGSGSQVIPTQCAPRTWLS